MHSAYLRQQLVVLGAPKLKSSFFSSFLLSSCCFSTSKCSKIGILLELRRELEHMLYLRTFGQVHFANFLFDEATKNLSKFAALCCKDIWESVP